MRRNENAGENGDGRRIAEKVGCHGTMERVVAKNQTFRWYYWGSVPVLCPPGRTAWGVWGLEDVQCVALFGAGR